MKSLWKNDDFCRDAFGEELSAADVREVSVAAMVRTRKRIHYARGAKVACVVGFLMVLTFTLTTRKTEPLRTVRVSTGESELKIHSVPFNGIVRSQGLTSEMVVRSESAETVIVRTDPGRLYQQISEEQLLDMLRGRALALVKTGRTAILEFLDSEE